MSAEKRSVHTDALATLGTIIDETAGRDAIHLAVEPSMAAEKLFPGQDVGFVEGGVGFSKTPVGIVDPFLKAPVQPGQMFWLVVYPRQITSLRHVWEHPAFEGPKLAPKYPASEQWIRDYADRLGLHYNDLMEGAAVWIESKANPDGWGEYLVRGGLLEGEYTSDEFWPHYEVVTSKNVPAEARANFFSCSC